MNIVFHYPPELLSLLIDTIPRLCRSKKDVLLFFKGAGVSPSITNSLTARLNKDKDSLNKFEIARTVLTRLNEKGEATLRERREVLKRVVEFEDFSTCWSEDQLKAKGLVAEIRRVVDVKDSFTRMKQEREDEARQRRIVKEKEVLAEQQRREVLREVRRDLLNLFKEQDAQRRGKALESVLNRLFKAAGILTNESFTIAGMDGEGIVEQIDGVVEIDGELYFVEMKWWRNPIGVQEISQHLIRVFSRDQARCIFVSASEYTEPAITTCRDALCQKVVVLCTLREIILVLEKEVDLKRYLKEKIKAAVIHKNPFFEPDILG
jgi:restriction system protein